LHSYPKGRKQIWFDRHDGEIEFPGEGLRGEKLELARRTRSDGLFLSVAAQFNHDQLLPVFESTEPERSRCRWILPMSRSVPDHGFPCLVSC